MNVTDFARWLGRKLDFRSARGNDLLPADEVRVIVAADIDSHFAESTAPDGTPWPLLKRRRGKPLILAGKLRKSARRMALRAKVEQNRQGTKISLDRDDLEPYGPFHDDGTRTIPRREFTGLSDKALDRIAESTADAVVARLLR